MWWPLTRPSPNTVSASALLFTKRNEPYIDEATPISYTENDLVVKVLAAALNPLDIKLATSPLGWFIPGVKGVGKDFCGIIERVGSACDGTKWKVGDRICGKFSTISGPGSVATKLVVNPTTEPVLVAPEELSDAEAAAFPLTYETSYECLSYFPAGISTTVNNDAAAPATDRLRDRNVLILGGSTACGIMAIQLAKQVFGAATVVATCSPTKNELLASLGADHLIDYRGSVVHSLKELGKDLGLKYDVIYDCVGGHDVLDNIDEFLNSKDSGAYYVTIVGDTASTGPEDGTYTDVGGPLAFLYRPAMTWRALTQKINYIVHAPGSGHTWQLTAAHVVSNPQFTILLDHVYPLAEWRAAWDRVASRRAIGKVVISME